MNRIEQVLNVINDLKTKDIKPTTANVGEKLNLTRERVRQILEENEMNIKDFQLTFKNSQGYHFGVESEDQLVEKYLHAHHLNNLTVSQILNKVNRDLKLKLSKGKLYKTIMKLGIDYKTDENKLTQKEMWKEFNGIDTKNLTLTQIASQMKHKPSMTGLSKSLNLHGFEYKRRSSR